MSEDEDINKTTVISTVTTETKEPKRKKVFRRDSLLGGLRASQKKSFSEKQTSPRKFSEDSLFQTSPKKYSEDSKFQSSPKKQLEELSPKKHLEEEKPIPKKGFEDSIFSNRLNLDNLIPHRASSVPPISLPAGEAQKTPGATKIPEPNTDTKMTETKPSPEKKALPESVKVEQL